MPGIKPECRFPPPHHPPDPGARQAGDPAARAASAPPCCPGADGARPEYLETPACHLCRTRGADGGTGLGMEWPWVLGPAGEGIMIEVAGGNDPGQARHLWPKDLATILADSVVLLQTPAVGRAC